MALAETELYREACARAFKVRDPISPSQWAQEHLSLPSGLHARPGPFVPFPFQLEPLDCITEGHLSGLTLCWASQVLGKSQLLAINTGWTITENPCGIVVIMPTLDSAQAWSRNKLGPMLRDTAILQDLVMPATGRKQADGTGGSTVLMKTFIGGFLVLVGSSSPSGLASHTARIVICDELDRLDPGGAEGDPLAIASRRSETFPDSFRIQVSSPTIKGASRIEDELAQTDCRQWHLKCLGCEQLFVLSWENIRWEKTSSGEHLPQSAMVQCPHCLERLSDNDRVEMVRKGKWIATRENTEPHQRGYQANAFITLLPEHRAYRSRLHQWASEWLSATKKGADVARTFVNTVLAIGWDEPHPDMTRPEVIYARREVYSSDEASPSDILLNEAVRMITVGVDTQVDRLELEVVGWSPSLESWSLDYRIIRGNLSQQTIWTELTSYLQSEFRHPWGFPWKVDACAIDTGGTYTKNVYAYTYSRPIRNIFGIKGKSVSGQSWLERSDKVRGLYVVATDVIKRGIYDNLSIVAPAPGYCHIPAGRDYTWSEQLVSEVPIARKVNNTIVMRFDLPKGRRNEALDCRVLARTALEILRPNWRGLEKVFEARRAAAVQTTSAEYVPGPERLQQDPVITQRPTPPAPKPHQPQRRFRRPSFWGPGGITGTNW
jgi:phage terminase large subunit GpA-like protein